MLADLNAKEGLNQMKTLVLVTNCVGKIAHMGSTQIETRVSASSGSSNRTVSLIVTTHKKSTQTNVSATAQEFQFVKQETDIGLTKPVSVKRLNALWTAQDVSPSMLKLANAFVKKNARTRRNQYWT